MQRQIGIGTGMLLSLGLLAGCGGSDGKGAATGHAESKPSASAARHGGPAYQGPALPGLAEAPAWSVPVDGSTGCAGDPALKDALGVVGADPQVCVLGDAVVLTQDRSGNSGTSGDSSEDSHFRARLYDAADGRVRRTIDFDVPEAWAGDRRLTPSSFVKVIQDKDGNPALLVVAGDEIAADGLKKASVKTTYTLYAPSGAVLGRSSFTGDAYTHLPAEAGHLLLKEGYGADTYTPIGGGPSIEVPDRDHDQDRIGSGFGYRVGSTYNVIDGSGSRLVVSDRRSGKQLWTLEDVDRPAALAHADDPKARLHPLTADKGLLAWELPDGSAHDVLLTVVDLRTGRLLAQGPQADVGSSSRLMAAVSPDGSTAVTDLDGGGAVAWNLTTGKELWRQEDGEQDITPLALPRADLLYADVGDLGLTALDMTTKKVLAKGLGSGSFLQDGDALQFTTDGHAVLAGDGLFVFAPQRGSRG
ncbi:PQQ-binding-like beta-propeller repeat protein [Streptomyces sp. NPDC047085]|uniref:outer membrane protein assembly factor BamB family protein n=1 Tax=Streptomyces sp. NPDC047085 TaxID=3155140 RepID=UPI0033C3477E